MDTPYVIEPNKLYNEKWMLNFLGIGHETLLKNYINKDLLRYRKIGNNYYFLGQWIIDDFVTFGEAIEK